LRRYACWRMWYSEEGRLVTGEENKRVYERYIGLLNAQDFGALGEVVDPGAVPRDLRWLHLRLGGSPRGGRLAGEGGRRHSRPERPHRRH
jgi:hypothetical protein